LCNITEYFKNGKKRERERERERERKNGRESELSPIAERR